jgi:hypothetical protein
MISATILYKRNGQYLRVKGVTRGDDNTVLSDAVVTATLHSGSARVPEISGLVLQPIPTSPGDYQGLVLASFNPRDGVAYILDIDIVRAPFESAHRELPVKVQTASSM